MEDRIKVCVAGKGQGDGERVWVGEIGQRCGTGKMGKVGRSGGLGEMGKGMGRQVRAWHGGDG